MTINRRDLLGKTLAGVATAGLAMPAAAVAQHPDAALLEAFDGYVRANRMFQYATEELLPNGGTDADHEPFYAAIDHYADRLAVAEARTVDGLRAQVRFIFAKVLGSVDAFEAAIYGQPPTPALAQEIRDDFTMLVLWNMTGCGRLDMMARV